MVSPPAPAPSLDLSHVLRTSFPVVNQSSPGTEMPVYVIPQGREPRWVVVGDPRKATKIFRSWRPFKMSTRLRWSAVVAASGCGLLARLPGVISTTGRVDLSYWRQLPGFDDCVPVLYIGNPSYTRKITLFFVGPPDQGFKAVAKVPLFGESQQAILNEADVLDQLRGADYLPTCIFRDPQRGVAAQSWLEGAPVSRELTPAHMEMLGRLATRGAMVRVSDQRETIALELDQADFPFDREVIKRAQEFLDYDVPLPAFVEHRDFAPWNLKRLEHGQTGAIDWEWATLRGLPCQDIFRYFYIQDALFHGPGDAWQVINNTPLVSKYYRRFEIPSEALLPLVFHYLLRVLPMDWQGRNAFLAEYSFNQIKSLLAITRSHVVRR